MKNLILLFALTLTLSCCNKDDNPSSSKDQLPAETQTGANTAGCLLNGQVFIPHQRGLNAALLCNYEFLNGKFYFNLVINDNRESIGKTVSVRTGEISLATNSIYPLNISNTIFQPDFIGGGGVYGIGASNYFYTNSIKTGELKITRLDLSNSIISGTFWFDAVNSAGETVQIRSGRFDFQYTN
ncbi:DUF6252 family protein [Flavobacterium branchiophilum]|uniref:Lipoprotein n=1 Tax=Flavobacterium branchiophilum TaxID=55197 RepID=A0A543FZK0_9FLAO|nr:DUF6252 family protein [Flavobacterium branchiophilum]TQM39259.1 hypothetical protein BC670_0033 [Flavobacterium branchiophilum]GEM54107.1 hypothetical protein FB1_03280 [Flavobacterium branchiophilum NBRC 15030 = ATCC 35035]